VAPLPPCPPGHRRDPTSGGCHAVDCAATAGTSWRRRFALDSASTEVKRLVVAPNGTIVLAASLSGDILLRTRPPGKPSDLVESGGSSSVLLAKLDPAGHALWGRSFGGRGGQYASDAAVDPGGSILVTGELGGTMSYGGPKLKEVGESDIHFAKLDAIGQHQWSKSFGNPRPNYRPRVATLSTGRVVLTGFFYGALDVGGGPIASNDGNSFVALYEPDGRLVWSLGVGGSGPSIDALAVTPDDHIVIFGSFARPLQLPPTPELRPVGLRDLYLAKLDAHGRAKWSKRFGKVPTASQHPQGLAVDREGNIIISGRFEGAVGFGGIPLKAPPNQGRLFVAKLGPDGSHRFSKMVGSDAQYGNAGLWMAADGRNRVHLGGSGAITVDFGGPKLVASPGWTPDPRDFVPIAKRRSYVALLGADGSHVSSMLYGNPGDVIHAVAADDCHHTLVAGVNDWVGPNNLFVGRLP